MDERTNAVDGQPENVMLSQALSGGKNIKWTDKKLSYVLMVRLTVVQYQSIV